MFHEEYGGYHIKSTAYFYVTKITQNGNIGLKMRDRLKIGHFWHLLRLNLSLCLYISLSLSRLLLVLTVISVPPQNFTKKCLNTITQHAIDLWSNNISVHLSLCACLFRFSFELRKKHKEWLSSYEKQFLLALRSLIHFSELVNIHQLFIYSNSLHNIDPVKLYIK